MPAAAGSISAFSCWFDDTPIALLRTTGASRSRARFDAAHELGHLMMHKDVEATDQTENEADEFAGSLLLPTAAFDRVDLKPFSWENLRDFADQYGVTVLAALYRAHRHGLISRQVYTAAMKHAGRHGWTKMDPFDRREPEKLATDR